MRKLFDTRTNMLDTACGMTFALPCMLLLLLLLLLLLFLLLNDNFIKDVLLNYAFRAGYIKIFEKVLKDSHIRLIYNCRIIDYN